MSVRLAVAFVSLCVAGGAACAALLVALAPERPSSASASEAIVAEPSSAEPPRAGLRRMVEPLEPPLPVLPTPTPLAPSLVVRTPRPIDVADPWTHRDPADTDEEAMHLFRRRVVSRAPRPIDVADPWQPGTIAPSAVADPSDVSL